jgi:hypothetical protein
LDRPDASEQIHDLGRPTASNHRELPAQRTQPQLVTSEAAHGTDVSRNPENASPVPKTWPDLPSETSLAMDNQGRRRHPVRYPDRMQRVALLT